MSAAGSIGAGKRGEAMSFARAFVALVVIATLYGCGNSTQRTVANQETNDSNVLTAADVTAVWQAAAASVSDALVIAVVDRPGHVLAVVTKPGAPTTATGNFGATVSANELAVALARTAAFFSNNQAPLSSRTVRFISGIHFPPGVTNAGNAALYGIENTNRGCTLDPSLPGLGVPQSTLINGSSPGLGIITGKKDVYDSDATAVNPGGVPLFKNGQLVGGVGVVASTPEIAEFAALNGAASPGDGVALPLPLPNPGAVYIDGISLPFVLQTTIPSGVSAGTATGATVVAGSGGPGSPVPDNDIIAPHAGSMLTADEVTTIVNQAVTTANQTRAVIRLPPGQRARMVIAVTDLDGTLLALNRMPDATVFSIDVAVSKARNMTYFNSQSVDPNDLPGVPNGTAVTNRTISFGAQPLYPPGIDGSNPGPFFALYTNDTANPCSQGTQPASPGKQSGIVFFPGSVGLYKNGVLVGGLGVSGDGVEQDDYVTNGGAAGFEAATNIRADQIIDRGVRLPYLKFPRNPTQ